MLRSRAGFIDAWGGRPLFHQAIFEQSFHPISTEAQRKTIAGRDYRGHVPAVTMSGYDSGTPAIIQGTPR